MQKIIEKQRSELVKVQLENLSKNQQIENLKQ